EVREEVALVFPDAAEPTEWHRFLDAGHRLHLLQMGHWDDESERNGVTRNEAKRTRFFGATVKLRQDGGQTYDQKERDDQTRNGQQRSSFVSQDVLKDQLCIFHKQFTLF